MRPVLATLLLALPFFAGCASVSTGGFCQNMAADAGTDHLHCISSFDDRLGDGVEARYRALGYPLH
ncbi:MAG: hypothetical protein JO142_04330 [Burkholderiales bacterium]|nr:hypothetical protein [Burkholderiales bacterium]